MQAAVIASRRVIPDLLFGIMQSYPRVPLAERLGALYISQHKRHLVSSIAQQLLYPCQLTYPRVAVLGPQKANADNGEHGQQHWQYNLVPSAFLRKDWYNMNDAPAHAKQNCWRASLWIVLPTTVQHALPQRSTLLHERKCVAWQRLDDVCLCKHQASKTNVKRRFVRL